MMQLAAVRMLMEDCMKRYQVELPDEFVPLVERLLANGWGTLDELVMDGLLRSAESLDADGPAGESEAVRIGIEQADRGETVDGPATLDRLRAKLRSLLKQPA